MKVEHEPVGLRELRHNTSEVLSRVRRGETVDVTEYGRLFARPARSDVEALLRTVLAKEVTDCRSPLPVVSDLTLANVDY